MTAQLDIERVLDDFLGDGTNELSDHVLDAALRDVSTTRQRRAQRVPRRFSDMPTPVRLLAAAAILATALGGAFLLGGTINRQTTPEPSPLPSVPPSDPVEIGSNPAGLYLAQRPDAFGMAAGEVQLEIPPPGLQALIGRGPDGREILLGTIDNADNRATLSATDRCPDPGTYEHALSDDKLTFELTMVTDTCTDRSTFLVGTWQRQTIIQPVESGSRHELGIADKTLSFTVPSSFRARSGPVEADVFLDQTGNGWHNFFVISDDLYVSFVTESPPTVFRDRCDPSKGRADGPATIEEFLAWNRAATSVTISEPKSMTIAGFEGVSLDITAESGCTNDDALWDGLVAGMTNRTMAADIGGRLIIIVGYHLGPPYVPLTPEELDTIDELVASLTLD
jgi:hypothetical protein